MCVVSLAAHSIRPTSGLSLPAITLICMGHPPPAPSLTPTCLTCCSFCPRHPLHVNPAFTNLSLLVPFSKPLLSVYYMQGTGLSAMTTETNKARVSARRSFQAHVRVTCTRRQCRWPGSTKQRLEAGGGRGRRPGTSSYRNVICSAWDVCSVAMSSWATSKGSEGQGSVNKPDKQTSVSHGAKQGQSVTSNILRQT